MAFELARRMGADILEMDVRLTRDGRVVVFHDDSLLRVTGLNARVRDLDWSQVRALDAGARFVAPDGRRFAGQGIRVPLFEEVLRRFPNTRLNVELKEDDVLLARKLHALLKRSDAFDRCLVNSMHSSVLREYAKLGVVPGQSAAGPLGASFSQVLRFLIHSSVGLDYDPPFNALQIPNKTILGFDLTSEQRIDFAHWRMVRVHYWTINTAEEMRHLLKNGADGIMTDRPDLARRTMRNMGLRR